MSRRMRTQRHLPGRAQLYLDRDDASRDHARRRRGCRPSLGRALCADRRQALAKSGRPKEHRRLIPIITDEYPDPKFGSGAVKITGAP